MSCNAFSIFCASVKSRETQKFRTPVAFLASAFRGGGEAKDRGVRTHRQLVVGERTRDALARSAPLPRRDGTQRHVLRARRAVLRERARSLRRRRIRSRSLSRLDGSAPVRRECPPERGRGNHYVLLS